MTLALLTLGVAACCAGATTAGEPVTLPIAAQAGDLRVSLNRLVTDVSWSDPKRAVRGAELRSSVAAFSVTENGNPAPYKPVELELVDREGKRWQRSTSSYRNNEQEIVHQFTVGLETEVWNSKKKPADGAWSLRVGFSRTSGFAAEELWTVRSVAVPELGADKEFKAVASTSLQETTLKLRSLIPPGGSFGEPVKFRDDPPRVGVSVVMEPKRDDLQVVLVKAVDDRGREATPVAAMTASGSCITRPADDPTRRYHFRLNGLASDAKTIDLTFAVPRTRYVQFQVTPLQAKKFFSQNQQDRTAQRLAR
jgi:hypothetical protein